MRIDGTYFVLGDLPYPASCETGLGLLAFVPEQCRKLHLPGVLYGVLYGYVHNCYETYHIP